MYLNQRKISTLRNLFWLFSEKISNEELRLQTGHALLHLLDADYFASYIWDTATKKFGQRVAIEMGNDNLIAYENYYQFHDPITPKLRLRQKPTLVNQIMPQQALIGTEFYNDFLAKDGLHYGMNFYAKEDALHLGDLRIWRSQKRPAFQTEALEILDLISLGFTQALKRSLPAPAPVPVPDLQQISSPPVLQGRILEIALCVCQGLPDKQIARQLRIEHSTVRTYINRLFIIFEVHNRTQLAFRLTQTLSPSRTQGNP